MWVAEHQMQTRCGCGASGPTSAGAPAPGRRSSAEGACGCAPREYPHHAVRHSRPRNTLQDACGPSGQEACAPHPAMGGERGIPPLGQDQQAA